jgi:hypothetical protein
MKILTVIMLSLVDVSGFFMRHGALRKLREGMGRTFLL